MQGSERLALAPDGSQLRPMRGIKDWVLSSSSHCVRCKPRGCPTPGELPLAPTNPASRPRSSGGFISPRLELVAGSGRFKALLLEQAAAKEGVKQEQCREQGGFLLVSSLSPN